MRSLTVAATQFPVQTPTGAFDKANNAANIQAAEAVVREAAAAGAKLILVCLLLFFCGYFLDQNDAGIHETITLTKLKSDKIHS